MKTKTELVQVYRRYLDAIEKDNGMQIPTYFKKFISFLFKNTDDERLKAEIQLECINKTLAQVKKKEIKLKELSEDWSRSTIDEFYKLLNLLNHMVKSNEGLTDSYKVNFHKLWKLMDEQDDACMQLYMYLCHSNSIDGERLYKSSKDTVGKLLNASSDEEIEKILE